MFDAALALEKAKLERIHGCPIWQTRDKKLIPITKMETSHMYSAWRYMVKTATDPKSDSNYEKAMERLMWLQEEFKIRKLSYEAKDLEKLVKENDRKVRDFYDFDRDLDEPNNPFDAWWYMGDKD